eukprot:2274443-Rhodomonas_salina.1
MSLGCVVEPINVHSEDYIQVQPCPFPALHLSLLLLHPPTSPTNIQTGVGNESCLIHAFTQNTSLHADSAGFQVLRGRRLLRQPEHQLGGQGAFPKP